MKKLILVAVGVALVAGLTASLQPTEAACGNAYTITSKNGAGLTYFFTPGNPFGYYAGANVAPNGAFWSLGYGNAATATPPNNDSGARSGGTAYYQYATGTDNWIEGGFYGYGSYLGDLNGYATWQFPGTDGCIDFDGSNGDHIGSGALDPDQCNVVMVDDDDNAGVGYFMLASQSPTPGGDYNMNIALTGSGTGNVDLSAMPVPEITGSAAQSATVKDLVVNVPCPVGPAQGVYANCSSTDNDNLAAGIGVQLYSVTNAVGAAPGGARSRDLPSVMANTDGGNPSGWAPLAGGAGACGVPLNVTVSCGGDSSIYLCASLVVQGFETGNCSGNAVRVDCGPNLADPDAPVIKRDKPRMDRGVNRDRGSRAGGR